MGLDPGAVEGLGSVRIVGTGLLGTSIALGLSAGGADVLLSDPSPTALALARDLGAGRPDPGDEHVDLVVVAAPPDVTARAVAAELRRHPRATVTDVASVKSGIARQLAGLGVDLTRYVGSHPMAGRERSGPVAARGDLFLDRPWVLCPGTGSDRNRADTVRHLAVALGAWPVTMAPQEHDEAVALVSHLPQVAASLVAARLGRAPDHAVDLAGQGLRDVTRIAGSDPLLWAQILAANAGPVRRVLGEVREDLDTLIRALEALAAEDTGPAPGPGPARGAGAASGSADAGSGTAGGTGRASSSGPASGVGTASGLRTAGDTGTVSGAGTASGAGAAGAPRSVSGAGPAGEGRGTARPGTTAVTGDRLPVPTRSPGAPGPPAPPGTAAPAVPAGFANNTPEPGTDSVGVPAAPGRRARAAHGARAAVAGLVADGNTGRERIPGKHGGTPRHYAVLTVVVPDEPGSLGRLFADIGRAGANVEELTLEHAPGRAVGLLEVSVLPEARADLETGLADAGWRLAGSTGEPG